MRQNMENTMTLTCDPKKIESELRDRLNSAFLGWKCPQCGRIYSPWVDSCYMCGPTINFTYTKSKGENA